jgi:hypothetical protein
MELVFIIIVGSILATSSIVIIVGITIHDIHAIRLDQQFSRHPHARRWRKRPLVSIVINGEPSTACAVSIRRSNYRKVEIIAAGRSIKGALIFSLAPDTVLDHSAISQAVKQFNNSLSKSQVEMTPVLRSPQTLRQFFHNYYVIASAPFIAVRAGLGIRQPYSSWPMIVRLQLADTTRWTHLYIAFRWLTHVANLTVLLYVSYIAVVLYQPEFLLMYLAGFVLWMIWAIVRYRHLSFVQKITYLLLAPASLIYFAVRCLTAPFRLKQYLMFITTRSQSAIIES